MNEKIIDALTVIVENWRENKTIDEITKILDKDFQIDKGTATVAFSMFFEKILPRDSDDNLVGSRMFSESEQQIIGKENYNYLLKLVNLNIINLIQLEEIIDRIMELPEERIEKEDINWMALFAITELSNNLPPGSRFDLFSSDKIN